MVYSLLVVAPVGCWGFVLGACCVVWFSVSSLVMCLFFAVPWVGLLSVLVVFPYHTHWVIYDKTHSNKFI